MVAVNTSSNKANLSSHCCKCRALTIYPWICCSYFGSTKSKQKANKKSIFCISSDISLKLPPHQNRLTCARGRMTSSAALLSIAACSGCRLAVTALSSLSSICFLSGSVVEASWAWNGWNWQNNTQKSTEIKKTFSLSLFLDRAEAWTSTSYSTGCTDACVYRV